MEAAAAPPAEPGGAARKDAAAGSPKEDAAAPSTPAAVRPLAQPPGPRAAAPTGAARGGTSATVYAGLVGLLVAASPPLVFMPQLSAKFMFGSAADPPDAQHTHLMQLAAGTQLVMAGVAAALWELARRFRLHTRTAGKLQPPIGGGWMPCLHVLNLSLVAYGLSAVLTDVYWASTFSPWGWVGTLGADALLATATASQMGPTRIVDSLKRLPGAVASFFRPRGGSGLFALLLTALAPAVATAGALYFLAPQATLIHTFGYAYGRSGFWLWKAIGLGCLLVVPACTAVLKDKAAGEEALSDTAARALNAGLLSASALHLWTLAPILAGTLQLLERGEVGGALLPAVVGTWALAGLAAVLGLTSPKAASTTGAARKDE